MICGNRQKSVPGYGYKLFHVKQRRTTKVSIAASKKAWRSRRRQRYNPEFVAVLNHANREPPEAIFDEVDKLLNYLNEDSK